MSLLGSNQAMRSQPGSSPLGTTTRGNSPPRAARAAPAPLETNADGPSRDSKRAKREAVFARRERMERAERLRRRLIWSGVARVALAGLAGLGWWLFGPSGGPKVQTFPNLGQTHIQVG